MAQQSSDWFGTILSAVDATVVAVVVGTTAIVSALWATARVFIRLEAVEKKQTQTDEDMKALKIDLKEDLADIKSLQLEMQRSFNAFLMSARSRD